MAAVLDSLAEDFETYGLHISDNDLLQKCKYHIVCAIVNSSQFMEYISTSVRNVCVCKNLSWVYAIKMTKPAIFYF